MTGKRLGRVNNSAYDSWSSFLQVASQKFEMDFNGARRDEEAEGRVEVFQFLRCILGPVVESFLILDRKLWLKAELKVNPALPDCMARSLTQIPGKGVRHPAY